MTRKELLENIQKFAEDHLSKREIEQALELDPHAIDMDIELNLAFTNGHIKAIATHKQVIKRLANQGSGPAQSLLQSIETQSKLDVIRTNWS